MTQSDDLHALEGWLGNILSGLEPKQRTRFARKVGMIVRRNNAARIAKNEEPDGGSMAPRKSRLDRRGKVKRRGKMFRRIRLVKNMKIRPNADGVEIGFANPLVEKTAAVHHYGSEDYVGKTRDGRTIKAKYLARRLLGFGDAERDAILDMAAQQLTP
jgi:phage virion morphogenesis protein